MNKDTVGTVSDHLAFEKYRSSNNQCQLPSVCWWYSVVYILSLKLHRDQTTSLDLRRFSVAGPRVWNQLPHELRQCNTLSCFKSNLKTHYLIAPPRNILTYLLTYLLKSNLKTHYTSAATWTISTLSGHASDCVLGWSCTRWIDFITDNW